MHALVDPKGSQDRSLTGLHPFPSRKGDAILGGGYCGHTAGQLLWWKEVAVEKKVPQTAAIVESDRMTPMACWLGVLPVAWEANRLLGR